MEHDTHTFTAVSFKNGEQTVKIGGLSVGAAQEVARTHANLFGEAARIHCESCDYIKTFCPHGQTRAGSFAQTILVATSGSFANAICCERAAS